MELDLSCEDGGSPFTPPSSPSRSSGQSKLSNGTRESASASKPSTRGPFLIGVAGGTASGKTTVCLKIMEALEQENSSHQRVVLISQDSFYKNLSSREIAKANLGQYNFDHPGRRRKLYP